MTTSLVAIAGISGYTGQRMLPLLPASADAVRLLLRPATAKRAPFADDARARAVDLLSVDALVPALEGVEVIACMVGTTRAQFRPATATEPEVSYETVDIGIPRALAQAGKRAGAKRFVLLSSWGIDAPGAYPAAKRRAEAAVRESGLGWVVARPSFIVGEGRGAPKIADALLSPAKLFARGWYDDARSIDAADLAKAIWALCRTAEFDGRALSGRELHALARG
jgi:uncharacterized protein YbjT (DUF2867 family)